jgi:hypothetical protein
MIARTDFSADLLFAEADRTFGPESILVRLARSAWDNFSKAQQIYILLSVNQQGYSLSAAAGFFVNWVSQNA